MKTSTTRWQIRVNSELEKKVREHAQKEHRSINQTIIYILIQYYYQEEKGFEYRKESKINDTDNP